MAADIDATRDQLRAVAAGATDASGYFPAMYATVTERVAEGIVGNAFVNGSRMAEFACTFAGWYLRPRLKEGPVPGCWEAAFDVARNPRLLIVQHLLLGINAHVNHDLPQVVVALADEAGDLQSIRSDFDHINAILAATSTSILRELGAVAGWVNLAATAGGGRLFNFSLDEARSQAWGAAERLWPLDADGRRAYVAELDRLVCVLAYLITRPVFPLSLAVPALRCLEQRDPVKVTQVLLGAR